MSRLLWFLIGSAATLVAGAVAANYMDDDSSVDERQNDFSDARDNQDSPDDPVGAT